MRSRAIPLLTWQDENQKFVLDQEGLGFIRSLSSPLAVISVAGMYRTGKSYLLNRVFLNRSKAFLVGPSVESCTKGIWIWGEALKGTTEDGIPCNVLIVDTEGMGGFEKDSNYDSRIFSIATLISSCFIYNSSGALDENAIESLGLIINISKIVQASNPEAFSPKFMWVVRDFTLQLIEDDGNAIDPNEYLEKVLQPQKGFTETTENKNKIRSTLKNFFRDRECITLVRPTIDEKDLQNLDDLETSQLRGEFVRQIEELRKKALFEAKPKKVNGLEVNGNLLGNLLEKYIEAFNSGAVPNVDMAWDYVCKAQNRKVLEKAIEEYDLVVNETSQPTSETELQIVHKDAKKVGEKYLLKNMVAADASVNAEFKKIVREKNGENKVQNKYQLKLHYMNYLKNKYTQLDSAIKSGEFLNIGPLEKALKIVEKEYYEDCIDDQSKTEIYLSFAREITNKASDFIISNLNNEIKLQKSMSSEHIKKLTAEIQEANEVILKLKEENESQINDLKGDLTTALAKEGIYKEKLEKISHIKDELEVSLKELTKQKSADFEEYNHKLADLEKSNQDLIKKHAIALSEVDDDKALILQKLAFTETSLEDYKVKDKNYSEKLKDLRQEHTQSLKSLQQKFDQQIEKLTEKVSEKAKECTDLENEIDLKEALLEETQAFLNETKTQFEEFKAKTDEEILTLTTEQEEKNFLSARKIEKMEQEFKTSTARIRARLNETEKKLRNSEELLRSDMAIWAQDNAILVQKIEFLEQEVEEQKMKREEEKKHYKMVISTMESIIPKD